MIRIAHRIAVALRRVPYPIALAVAILAACGAPEAAPVVELGSLEQPITAMNGHGIAGGVGPSAPRCQLPTWVGGECWLPEETTWEISWGGVAAGETPPDLDWWFEEIMDGLDEFRQFTDANFAQWNISIVTLSPFTDASIRCGEPGGTALGQISPSVTCAFNCPSMPAGTLKKFHHAAITIDCKDIANNATWAAQTSPKRARYVKNVVKHELFHMMGLGHQIGQPGQLMNTTPDNGFAANSTWYSQSKYPSPQEQGFLEAFVGDND